MAFGWRLGGSPGGLGPQPRDLMLPPGRQCQDCLGGVCPPCPPPPMGAGSRGHLEFLQQRG